MLFFSVSFYFHSLPSVWNRAHDDDVKEQIKEAEVVKEGDMRSLRISQRENRKLKVWKIKKLIVDILSLCTGFSFLFNVYNIIMQFIECTCLLEVITTHMIFMN